MVKNLRFSLLSLLMLFAGTAFAEDVTISFDNDYATLFPTLPGVSSAANSSTGAEASSDGDFTETLTSTPVNGVTVTVSVADEGKTPNRIWNSSARLRMYSGTFTVNGTDITKIVFDAPSKFNMTAATGTLDGKTWTGDKTNEVVFTVGGNTQIKSITVTLGEGGGEVTPPAPAIEQITVAKALEIIEGLGDGAKTDKEYQVKGFVVTVTEISTTYGNATFTMADEKGGSPVLTFFRGKGFDGADISNENLVKEDDEVIVQGLLQKYVKNSDVTPEVAQGGKIISINGKTSEDGEAPAGTLAKPFTVAEAFAYIDGGGSDDVFVEGIISKIVYTFSAEYGTATFWISEDGKFNDDLTKDFEAYSVYYFGNKSWVEGNTQVAVGDKVVLQGKLTKYVKNDTSTYETSSKKAWIYSLNGKTE
jgi:hypothetical protein